MTTRHTYKRIDLCVILNLRDRAVRSNMPIAELGQMIGEVTQDELEFLKDYRDPPAELMTKYEDEGWFEKNYETVKKHAETYVRNVPGPTVVYTPDHANASARVRITRLLGFYAIKGREIPLARINLALEQQYVVERDSGIIVVNSGPGTGKTTTAAHKAARLAFPESYGETPDHVPGVLLVSYTNAAVANLHLRLIELVNDVSQISNKPGKRVWLTTIDSLSGIFLPRGQRPGDFDKQIEAAIRDHDQFASFFLTLDNRSAYAHIILDEAQDVSDQRFELLRTIYNKYDFKSFTIIGDPRQRLNIRHGGFYQELLLKGVESHADEITGRRYRLDFERPLVVKYHLTYRFLNPLLLELANVMSAIRPTIHSQLEQGAPGDQIVTPLLIRKFSQFEQVAADIIEKIQGGARSSSICIISPVTQKASVMKTRFDAIRQILATNGVTTSDQYGTEAVHVTSVPSVKGLEFDHVYFNGASGYPSSMNREYQDVNDGQSMNFVVNTRARYTLTYLTDASMRAPDGVPEQMTTGGEARAVSYNREVYPEAVNTTVIEPADYGKFVAHNMLRVPAEQIATFSTEGGVSNHLYEIVSAVLAHQRIRGLNTLQQVTEVAPMKDSAYRDYVRRGMIYDMRGRLKGQGVEPGATKIYLSESQLSIARELVAGAGRADETTLEQHRLLYECMTGRESDLTDMGVVNDVVMKIVSLLLRRVPRGVTEVGALQSVVMERILATTITTPTTTIVFTECLYLGALVKKREPTKMVFVVGLQSGQILQVGAVPKPLSQYEYMVHALFAITTHVRLMRGRGRFSLAGVDQTRPWYFVDTEFGPRKWLKSATVYDIALINGFDPYASTVSYLACDPSSFNPLLNANIRLEDLEGAPMVDDFYAFFAHLTTASEGVVIWYFSTAHDIAPFYEQHDHYMQLRELGPEGAEEALNPWKFNPDLDYPFEFRNARIGNAKGTMSELYEAQQRTLIGSYKHIRLHTAVSDALLLAEYVMTRELSVQ